MYGPGRWHESEPDRSNYSLLHTYCKEVDSSSLSSLEEGFQRKDAFGGEIALLAFQEGPIGVERDSVVTQSLDLLEHI